MGLQLRGWMIGMDTDGVRQWLLIGKVDNVVIELWVFTCTVAGYPSRQKRGDSMFHVECGNGYLYP